MIGNTAEPETNAGDTMTKYEITNQRDLRAAFWETKPYGYLQLKRHGKTQNDYPADTRAAWVDYVDAMARDGIISEALAQRATL